MGINVVFCQFRICGLPKHSALLMYILIQTNSPDGFAPYSPRTCSISALCLLYVWSISSLVSGPIPTSNPQTKILNDHNDFFNDGEANDLFNDFLITLNDIHRPIAMIFHTLSLLLPTALSHFYKYDIYLFSSLKYFIII